METSHHLLAILAFIIIIAKVFSYFSIKLKQPPVLGMLLVGLVIGPSGFHLIDSSPTISFFSEIGVIFLLFMAGLETDLNAMKRTGKSSISVALGGVLIPFALGFGAALFYEYPTVNGLVLGTILTATSVSVTVMTLIDLKRLRSVEGTTIMGAAIIDDILGILLLTFIFSFAGPTHSVWLSMTKIFGYLTVAILFGMFLVNPLIQIARKMKAEQGILSIALALCFLYAWSAETVEIASITGAYLAGLFLGQTNAKTTVLEGVETLGQSIFVSVFFVNIGLETHLWKHELHYGFTAVFIIVAIFSKMVGSGVGARMSGFSWPRANSIGIGMVPRGEVGLIIANMALARNLIGIPEFSATVFMVVLTAIITPFMLKWSFSRGEIK
jgi:Kef-type K+ transport system membrane component KefB